jgi:hypothetical protein
VNRDDPDTGPVVALVVLRPASGRAITGASEITAETLGEYEPDPSDAEAVAAALADERFEVGPLVGIAMSIAAPRRRFEEVFGVKLTKADDGGWRVVGEDSAGTRELPVDRLPAAVAQGVHAVDFEPPAELTRP